MTKPFIFVLMPFDKRFNDIYELGIRAACKNAGVYCERIDEQIFIENILDRIYEQVEKADYIVADMTGRNANVYYEVGYAHALAKRVILLAQKEEDIPFDLKHYPHIIYNEEIAYLKKQLETKIKWFTQNSELVTPKVKPRLRVWEGRDRVRPTFGERMAVASKSLFLVGFSFETLFKDHSEVLKNLLKRSGEVKVLMLHPYSKHTEAHDEFSSRGFTVRETIVNVIDGYMKPFINELKNDLNKESLNRLNIRLTYYLPRFAARIYDDKTMLMNFYLYKSRANKNPVIEISRAAHPLEFQSIVYSLDELFNYDGGEKGGHPNHKIIENGVWNDLLGNRS